MSVARCREINARLRAAGITVHELPGWESRGNGTTARYEGGVVHHTGGPYGSALPGNSRANGLVRGRPDLRGPLCNYAGNEDGSITVVAAHPANHAGASGGRFTSPLPRTRLFNRHVLGLEIIYPGLEPMRDAQYRAAVVWARVVAQVCAGGDAERIRAHAETSVTGKWDPGFGPPSRTIDMTAFRNAVRQEEDLTPDEHKMLKFLFDRVHGILPQRYYVPDPANPELVQEVGPDAPGAKPAHVLDSLDGNYLLRRLSTPPDDDAVTAEKLAQFAQSVATKVPRELADRFQDELRTAFQQGPA